ncbi:uncharacterized protein LOC112404619 isoform X5 [Neophocaena asiaeorientalis asiaeorientalis]|uniref:Uncharacterized protein LOC112404619 isoform X5 n=1 Tax=Neophocaena asiaeorientalis asiaeorientalis TaxID=1706337 RepID=A0A341C269_NEOAA|nr:uncharacterized protein LOC112404619 isoform X5 [Neophocaena asiaeorientalis asiaeorientalis]XP_024608437.1 uncharacterized protein LOC112404619 isoform X5 [Neophocaena asiaeorientalis asiaeorientalis]XP_024608438.1 uncharacterized protein LOC112404619 isoform X5 [Neophocaena asiaeorientalis asiaeorientalis]XP_024608440.1 uncharacterized protein LOC112404619 isoform X5 [Neophocaena asiaeorientalis asiaeorientalis]
MRLSAAGRGLCPVLLFSRLLPTLWPHGPFAERGDALLPCCFVEHFQPHPLGTRASSSPSVQKTSFYSQCAPCGSSEVCTLPLMARLKSPCWGRGNEVTCPVGHAHFGLTCWSRPVRRNFPSWTSRLLQNTVPTGKNTDRRRATEIHRAGCLRASDCLLSAR